MATLTSTWATSSRATIRETMSKRLHSRAAKSWWAEQWVEPMFAQYGTLTQNGCDSEVNTSAFPAVAVVLNRSKHERSSLLHCFPCPALHWTCHCGVLDCVLSFKWLANHTVYAEIFPWIFSHGAACCASNGPPITSWRELNLVKFLSQNKV